MSPVVSNITKGSMNETVLSVKKRVNPKLSGIKLLLFLQISHCSVATVVSIAVLLFPLLLLLLVLLC